MGKLWALLVAVFMLTSVVPGETPSLTQATTPTPETTSAIEETTPTSEATGIVETVTDQTIVLTFDFGEVTGLYSGDMIDGVPHGSGVFTTVNAEDVTWTYEGAWQDGFMEGEGITTWDTEWFESGTYSKNNLSGQGQIGWIDLIQYEGGFLDGMYHGDGALFDYYGELLYVRTFANGFVKPETPEGYAAIAGEIDALSQPCSASELFSLCETETRQYCAMSGTVAYVEPYDFVYGNHIYVEIYDQGFESNDTLIGIEYVLTEGEAVPEPGQWVSVWGVSQYLNYYTYDGVDMTVPFVFGLIIE